MLRAWDNNRKADLEGIMNVSNDLWQRFEKCGKLEDYLTFCDERRKNMPSPAPEQDAKEKHPEDQSSL